MAALNGTSVAAPAIARWIANHVNGNRLPGRSDLKAVATLDIGMPARVGHGGIDQADIDGLPTVPFPRIDHD